MPKLRIANLLLRLWKMEQLCTFGSNYR